MLIAGLTGGLACGKSFVAQAFHKLGCHVVEADELGREVMKPGGGAFHNIVQVFGRDIVDDEGNIDRRRLAQLVFSDPSALSKLNNLVHPAVRARARLEFEQIRSRDPQAVIIYVAAILIESGAYKEAGKIIVVNCSKERQFERAMARPGATEQDVLARIATQMPLQAKLRFADYVIDTDGTKQDTLRQTEEVYKELRNFAA
jgi:dephospho-CoA kinase